MPFHIVLSLTDACNIRCIHCYGASVKRSPDELSTEEVKSFIRNASDDGLLDIALSGGEPLLRPDLEQIVEYAAKCALTVGVGSNGWLLNKERIQNLKAAGLTRLQISVDGMASTHDFIRQRAGLFDRIICAINEAKRVGLRVNICFTVQRANLNQLQEVFDLALKLGVDGFNLSQFVPTGRGTITMDLTRDEWRGVYEWWGDQRAVYRSQIKMTSHLAMLALIDLTLTKSPLFRGCQAGAGQGAISATGDVYPCVVLPLVVGNIREASLKEIWTNSPVLDRLRNRTELKGNCLSCTLRDVCGGCRATAYATSGDIFGADPHCWCTEEPVRD